MREEKRERPYRELERRERERELRFGSGRVGFLSQYDCFHLRNSQSKIVGLGLLLFKFLSLSPIFNQM